MRVPLIAGAVVLVAGVAAAQNRAEDEYHALRAARPRHRVLQDHLRRDRGLTRGEVLLQPDPQGQRRQRRNVFDLASGAPLKFEQVSGAAAREAGLVNADLEGEYIKVSLARPVPAGGEARIRIIKTYKDPKSYYRDGAAVVFERPLGIKRNAVVLPANYELISCNIPSQILEEPDGRVGISFINTYPGSAPLVVRARPVTPSGTAASSTSSAAPSVPAPAEAPPRVIPMNRITVSERAFQDREIVYFLNDPATHSFSLYHDYTEKREGTDKSSTSSGEAARSRSRRQRTWTRARRSPSRL